MSLGDEHETSGGYGGTGQTRTRLPGRDDDLHGGTRRGGRSSSRSLVTVVGVVVLLIAAIAFANRGGGGSSSTDDSDDSPKAAATAPSGEKPVGAKAAGIPSGFAHDRQGAESAAANYAVALGSAEMFNKTRRDAILQAIIVPARAADFEATLDKAYTPEFNKNVGLNEDGTTPKGFTFVSRTSPIGTKVTESSADTATVEVWCSGLLGLAGESSTNPVTNSWFTITMQLEWTDDDWKIVTHSQKDGPTPVPGDKRASSADEMAKAVEEYGGFTYAR
ncbi:hypothetical protein DKG34_08510 [Streptomyces sp. NWU49]|uniref:Integral membrane protein n=1 Tax=Streptomyces viridosporus (strain ATCC 14672 / DSM 40746 / JCM 4963 / KCTC 9882 / NRRL B-12104 / FH 1290) TaxID=566461 RepID=D5ZS85_STRV1|nr:MULTISPECIES: hypothetical protein [Streptomyces]EFE68571.1 integral membrane protein [Streptomyces viridosporus ATCC 14672]PWJ07498.1 hypothetical protein DKG34_08510 [Streptomyces sp. NWU49]